VTHTMSQYANKDDLIKAQASDIERLRAALKPFTKVPLDHTADIGDGATVMQYEGGELTLGDFRQAHTAMNPDPNSGRGPVDLLRAEKWPETIDELKRQRRSPND
jgi:hypothetical protein